MRTINDLNDFDKGVFTAREEIKKGGKKYQDIYYTSIEHGLDVAVAICNELLDIDNEGDIASTKETLDNGTN